MKLFGEEVVRNSNELEKLLFELLPKKGWFIAGGYAVDKLKRTDFSNDIDIYFESEEIFNKAVKALDNHKTFERSKFSTELAETYYSDVSILRVQLIKKEFGTYKEILPRFDLSCCRVYFTPDKGVDTYNYDSRLILNKDNIHTSIIQRINKYSNRYNLDTTDAFRTLTKYIAENKDSTLYNYYDKTEIPIKLILRDLGGISYKNAATMLKELELRYDNDLLISAVQRAFMAPELLKNEYNLSLFTKALITTKTKTKPQKDVLEAYPEFFI